MASIVERAGTYYLYWSDAAGKRHGKRIGKDKEIAKNAKREKEREASLNAWNLPNTEKRWDQFKEETLAHYQTKRPSTAEKYKYAFQSLEKIHFPTRVADVSPLVAEKWVQNARTTGNPRPKRGGGTETKPLSQTSIDIHFRTLRAAFNRAVKFRYIVQNPFALVSAPSLDKKIPRFLNEAEMGRLLDAADRSESRDMGLIAAIYMGCGLRRQELLRLRLEDTDLNDGWFHIKSWGDWTIKTHEEREVPISPDLLPRLRRHCATLTGDLLFPGPSGNVRDPHSIDRLFNKLYKRAKIERAHGVHCLRHTFGYNAAKVMPLHVVQKIMGHKNIATTMIYCGVAREQMKEGMKTLRLPVQIGGSNTSATAA